MDEYVLKGRKAPSNAPEIDLITFYSDNFNAVKYLERTLPPYSEEAVRTYSGKLASAKSSAAVDLQKNVYKNYSEFIKISKEISKMESDMLVLRNLLNELKVVNDSVRDDEGNVDDTSSQSSVETDGSFIVNKLDQRLQFLYDNVEGIDKYIDESSPRELVTILENVSEVSNSFSKAVKNNIDLYLCNDVLICIYKKELSKGKYVHILDRCFPLNEIRAEEIKQQCIIRITSVKETLPTNYYCDNMGNLVIFIRSLKANIELCKSQENEEYKNEASSEKDTNGALTKQEEAEKRRKSKRISISTYSSARSPIKDELDPSDITWLSELPDELDVLIAQRDFDKAVGLIEKAKNVLSLEDNHKVRSFKKILDEKITSLVTSICNELSDPLLIKSQVKSNINRLLRLNMAEKAQEIFLSSRSDLISHRIRQLLFNGETNQYIKELATVDFTLIKNTCEWYNDSFKDPKMSSNFIIWVIKEIDKYISIFKNQVLKSKSNFSIARECIETTNEQIMMLKSVGLDMNQYIMDKLRKDIVISMNNYCENEKKNIYLALSKDNLVVNESNRNMKNIDGKIVILTSSLIIFEDIITRFEVNTKCLMNITFYEDVIKSFTILILEYINSLNNILLRNKLTNNQNLAVLQNCIYVIDNLLPSLIERLKKEFDRPIPEMDELLIKLQGILEQMEKFTCSLLSDYFLENNTILPSPNYQITENISDDASPTNEIIKFTDDIYKFDMSKYSILDINILYPLILEDIFLKLINKIESCVFTTGGVQQFVLDIHFFLQVCEKFINDSINQLANKLCEYALRSYYLTLASEKESNPEANTDIQLKVGDWYAERINKMHDVIEQKYPKFVIFE
ncbi:hypothetical protein H8356DRAFT_1428566 [Neocallimastix lanati (nom. inval.)]|jgi:hypothetical protein|uniref:Exocyst component Exo84 C-terminal domain-containing protein n=1 Tax=Neocallimastix californiae TaxID=1754190 RepID=A0A1Y2BZD6_9FUNG|nr:hypothetical protein H8356DRAFT_1428566 [Neocallimastix sp. JGI-2020a]ORY40034.1 hypothetical protein LY90DRAFT_37773 [Neocallimastix californiae]|eukprot:ORY40034.1 hypothetical protein LY90DRAFT_37773 [Neocallimastix californiae]